MSREEQSELHLDVVDAMALAHEGLIDHDIDTLVPATPEAFCAAEARLFPADPSPANQYINDPFLRGE